MQKIKKAITVVLSFLAVFIVDKIGTGA